MGELVKHGMSPHQIYEFLTTGPGTDLLDDAQAATRVEWEAEEDRATMIRRQGEMIRGGWQGTAADGAFGAAQPLAESAMRGVDELSLAEDLLDRQSGSFHRAANSVRPVPPEPPQIDMHDPMAPFSDFDKEVTTYQADVQHNLEVYHGYDGASEYNQTNMPAEYATINHSGGDIGVTTEEARRGGSTGDFLEVANHEPPPGGDDSPSSGERGDPGGGPSTGGSPVSGPETGGSSVGGPGTGGSPVGGPAGSQPPPRQTTPSDFVPSVATPSFPLPSTVPTGPTPGGFVAGLPFGGYPGGGTGGGTGSGTGGPGARGGGPGAGERGAPGTGVRGGVPGAGPGSAAIAAEEAAARRAAAAAAARGAGPGILGGAPVGGGRGKGDEDEEHQRKFLIEIDSESTFGSDVLTAPQVIGDDDYEDD